MREVPRNHFQYDVAFSYAGENEKFVRQIYGHLKAADVRVFFAPTRAGDLWGKDEREFQHVYQAYAAGMLIALRLSFKTTIKVGLHAVIKLHLLFREEDRAETLDVIERQARRWLERQVKTGKTRLIAFALWPVQVARRILARNDFGRKLTARRMTRVIREEVERGLGPARWLSKRGNR